MPRKGQGLRLGLSVGFMPPYLGESRLGQRMPASSRSWLAG